MRLGLPLGLATLHKYGSAFTPAALFANGEAGAWYTVPNDSLGPFTDTSHKVINHSNTWNPTTNSFDLSSLEIGDVLILRLSAYVTTASSNIAVFGKLRMAIASGINYDLPFYASNIKHAGKHLASATTMIYIGNAETRDYPAQIMASTDTGGVGIETDGWLIISLCRG